MRNCKAIKYDIFVIATVVPPLPMYPKRMQTQAPLDITPYVRAQITKDIYTKRMEGPSLIKKPEYHEVRLQKHPHEWDKLRQ